MQTLNKTLEKLIIDGQTRENIELAYWLIKAGADPNTRNKDGITIIWPIINLDDAKLLERFFKLECSIKFNSNNNYPIDYAIDNYKINIIDWILSNKLDADDERIYLKCKKIHYLCTLFLFI